MKIKDVIAATGLTDRAIRLYIENGLVAPENQKSYSGRNNYNFTQADIDCFEQIAMRRATPHRDLFAPKQTFSSNTSLKKRGRRQPYRAFLARLAEKFLALECFAVLNRRFFLAANPNVRRNT